MEYPEQVDLVVLGTGLVQSIIACAAARQGKSVCIMDSNEYYGGHGASLNMTEFQEWAQAHAPSMHNQAVASSPDQRADGTNPVTDGSADSAAEIGTNSVTAIPISDHSADVQVQEFNMQPELLSAPARGHYFDLAHQVLESTGPCVQAIRDINLHHSLEFAAVTSAHTWHSGRLFSTPSSKAAVLAAPGLSLSEKRTLSLFLANAQHAASGGASDLFLASHFKAALEDFGLHPSVQDGLLYSVLQAESPITRDTPLSGQHVLAAMAQYMAQSGAYVAEQAPFIECRHGSCEVAQAFVRQACVFGGIVSLGTAASHILVTSGAVCGVRMASGHTIHCSTLLAPPDLLRNFPAILTDVATASQEECAEEQEGSGEDEEERPRLGCMGRAVILLKRPVLPELTNCQVVFPPGACGNANTVTAWHAHSSLATCAPGRALVYLSLPHSSGADSLECLKACAGALLDVASDSTAGEGDDGGEKRDGDAEQSGENGDSSRPQRADVLLECYYTQQISRVDPAVLPKGLLCCDPVGREWTMDSSLLLAERLFKRVYPELVFLTQAPPVGVQRPVDEDELDAVDAALKDLGLD